MYKIVLKNLFRIPELLAVAFGASFEDLRTNKGMESTLSLKKLERLVGFSFKLGLGNLLRNIVRGNFVPFASLKNDIMIIMQVMN